jgi:hypothetical protein
MKKKLYIFYKFREIIFTYFTKYRQIIITQLELPFERQKEFNPISKNFWLLIARQAYIKLSAVIGRACSCHSK